MTYTPDNEIDHIDNDKSNNNIENLRIVNNSENQQNIHSTKGYTWIKRDNKYRAQIKVNKKQHYLGLHDTIDEAREAYLIAKEKYPLYINYILLIFVSKIDIRSCNSWFDLMR